MSRSYDLPLVDWISLALHTDSLSKTIESIRKNKKLEASPPNYSSNRRYMEKILREEVIKQFDDPRRPRLEIILNAIDAKPKEFDEEYNINILLKAKRFIVQDNGVSLNLEQLLRLLIIPFNTEKEGIEEIGRFGVGFLSNFYYCIRNNNTEVVVTTVSEEECFTIMFYATNDNVSGLRMKIKKKQKRKLLEGTKVEIRFLPYDIYDTTTYLQRHLSSFPNYIANVFVNTRKINSTKQKWHVAKANLVIRGKRIPQEVGFRIVLRSDPDYDDYCNVKLTSQGVRVRSFNVAKEFKNYGVAIVSFPSGVKVVEGRDEFKIDKNYKTCVDAVFRCLEKYIIDREKTVEFIEDIGSFFPALMSAFGIDTIKDVPNLSAITNALVPNKRYALTKSHITELSPFLGKKFDDLVFQVSHEACSYWRELYGSHFDIYEVFLRTEKVDTAKEFHEKQMDDHNYLPNMCLLGDKFRWDSELLIKFVEVDPYGETPILLLDGILFINTLHPHISGKFSFAKNYSVVAEYIEGEKNNYSGEEKEASISSSLSSFDRTTFSKEVTQCLKEHSPTC